MTNRASSAHPTIVSVDPLIPGEEQKGLHNRWHPDIPPVATVKPGQTFKVECVDASGGQCNNDDCSDDIKNADFSKLHFLSGPIAVEGAEPGDCLVVDILDVKPFDQMPWGFSGIFELSNGGLGIFDQEFKSKAAKAIWDIEGVYASSRHIPGVRFAGTPHPGIIGTAPSTELLEKWTTRERELREAHADVMPPVAHLPLPVGTHVGQKIDDALREKIAAEGARTLPGRENGGNCDIKNLSRGSRCYFPVFVKGANLSVGDLHFSQGDGEITFCGGIEMAGIVTLSTSIIKGGVEKFSMRQPIFVPSPVDPVYSQKLIFEGISVNLHGDGKQHYLDATMAFKQAALNAIDYLMKVGYTREQSYIILSAAPIDSHIAALVDIPNACVTVAIPTAIFDHDIMPKTDGLVRKDFGQCAMSAER